MSITTPGDLNIDGATFVRNGAASGGAISLVSTTTKVSGPDYNLTSCRFLSNSASDGGGLYLFNSARGVNVKHSMSRGNSAVKGGPCRTKTFVSTCSARSTCYIMFVLWYIV